MNDIFEDIFDEADAVSRVDTGTGKQLSHLVRTLRNVESQIEDAESHIKALKAEKHKLSVEGIPALMDEMGVERLDVDGMTVERKMMVAASIPVANKDQAFDWLRSNMQNYKSMDATAEAIAGKIVPVTFRTARKWVKEYKDIQSAGRL